MLDELEVRNLPKAPPLRKLIGPSFILLGLGLGSGELILWPYLSANFGLGIIWAAVVGITIQFFLNMEIVRYTIANGESIFVGLTRKFGKVSPIWFLFSTLIPWMWPGIAASSAKLFSFTFGIPYSKYLGIFILLLIGVVLSLGKIVYKTQERFQKAIIVFGVPFISILALIFAKTPDYASLFKGLAGIGEGYILLPKNLPLATFLGALAYAGAGGTLNLAQSFYAKEKGYGMGKFAGRITGMSSKKEDVKLEGATFPLTPQNLAHFKDWWKKINTEHAIVFWATGAVTMILLSLLSYSTVFGMEGIETGINFITKESFVISTLSYPTLGIAFSLTAAVMLFATQFGIIASTSRIASENLILANNKKFKVKNSSQYFFIFLWLQIALGVIIFLLGFTEPLSLIVIGATLNAGAMFVYSAMLFVLNSTILPKKVAPNLFRKSMLIFSFIFYGAFTAFTLYNIFPKL